MTRNVVLTGRVGSIGGACEAGVLVSVPRLEFQPVSCQDRCASGAFRRAALQSMLPGPWNATVTGAELTLSSDRGVTLFFRR